MSTRFRASAMSRPIGPAGPLPFVAGRVPSAVWLAAAVVWAATLAWLASAEVSHDPSWYLFATRRWLEGATLYADIIEINPPLAFYLTAPAILLADLSGLPEGMSFHLTVMVLALVSTAAVALIVDNVPDLGRAAAGTYVLASLALSLFGLLPEFGQREHLLLLFTLPYATHAAFRPLGLRLPGWTRAAIGVFAAFGLLLKPHFLLAPLLISVALCWTERSLRPVFSPENWAIGLAALAYAAGVAILHPEYLASVVPLGLATYGGYDRPLAAMFDMGMLPLIVTGLLVVLCLRERPRETGPAVILLAAAVAFLIGYLTQMKGWRYQYFPAHAYATLAGMALAVTLPAWWRSGFLSALALTVVGFNVSVGGRDAAAEADLRKDIGALVENETYVALNVDLPMNFPFVNAAGAIWASRYPSLWPLPGIIRNLASADPAVRSAAQAAADDLRRNVAADFERFRPRYVHVQVPLGQAYIPDGFDYLAFLSVDPRFAAQWAAYRKRRDLAGGELWERSSF